MNEEQKQIIFRRQAMQIGNSVGITLPPEVIEYLQIQISDEIGIVADQSKHGNFCGIWNETRQKQTKLKK